MGAAGQLIVKRYRLVRALGQGATGIVWEGHDTLLDRPVAVRQVLLPSDLRETRRVEIIQRIAREARHAERLRHPHIAAVHDVAEEDGELYLIMELVRSRSLDGIVAGEGPLPPGRAATIARNVLSALTYAHASGVRHGDVRPANVLIGHDGRVVLADFGIASLAADPAFGHAGGGRTPAHGGPISRGTAAFLAPERMERPGDGPATVASDLWSLGATLHMAVTGKPPAGVPGDVPGPIGDVVRGLLAKEPRKRLSAEAADQALAELETPPPASARPRGGSRTKVIAGVAAVLVAGAVGGWAVLRPGPAPGETGVPTAMAAKVSPKPSATPSKSQTPAKTLKLTWYKSDAGWKAGVPKDWNRVPADFAMWWFDPKGRGQLTVEVTEQSGTDPLGALREAEAMLRPTVTGYTKVRLKSSSTKYGPAADWEFTWTQRKASDNAHLAKGVAYHQFRRVISTDTTTSVLTWTTTAADWERLRATQRKAFSLFKPPA
ncbi:hypothetical protein Pth03_07000 [Planotetraspora thailandica]|uniref:non-specific serine/threonine protein kinase n=1 Tax=Planotetraspora thailandica TaxID=487172 RepID=A0A8J3XU56_9ACTN|nr:serine/threonine-protein kinase [Planotetraspora thailandica]GII52311.1 hypothetical protein Pth03_07000 [Planotetraspora thailandica]